MVETVIQRSRNRLTRIVRQQSPSGYKNYVVEQFVDGRWIRSKNGPWDRLFNARRELRSILLQLSAAELALMSPQTVIKRVAVQVSDDNLYVIVPDPMAGKRNVYTVHCISLRGLKHARVIGRSLPIKIARDIVRKHAKRRSSAAK